MADRVLSTFALSVLSVALLASIAQAARPRPTVQWLFGGSDEENAPNSTRYYPPSGKSVLLPSTTPGTRQQVWTAGAISRLYCGVAHDNSNDLGDAGTRATVTLLKNGLATALSGTISGGPGFERDCSPAPDEDVVTIEEGDTLEMQYTVVGTPNPNGRVFWSFQFQPAVANHFVMPSGFVWWTPTPVYGRAFGYYEYRFGTPEEATRFVSPIEGRFTRLLCRQSSPQTSGTHTWTLTRDGVETDLSCPIEAGSDRAIVEASVAVAAGDSFSFVGKGSDQPSPVAGTTMATLVWTPEIRGHYFLAGTGNVGWSSSAIRFQSFEGPRTACTTERTANATRLAGFDGTTGVPLLAIEDMIVRITTKPGPGQSWHVELVEQPTTDDTIPPTTPRGPDCTIDALCPAPPCFCTSSVAHTPLWNEEGPSWYEFRITPSGLPVVPYAQLSLHVARATEESPVAAAGSASLPSARMDASPAGSRGHRGGDSECDQEKPLPRP